MKAFQLLNYPGSKLRLLPEIQQRIDRSKKALIEPFLGGASVMLNLSSFHEQWCGDIIPYVVRALQIITGEEPAFERAKDWLIRLQQERVIVPPPDILRRLRKGDSSLEPSVIAPYKKAYYDYRSTWNEERHDNCNDTVAMGFLFLAGGCVNNLVRFGRTGDFNQGWGARSFNVENLDKARSALKGRRVHLYVSSFEQVLTDSYHVWPDAFVYLDPPYGGRTEAATNGLYGLNTAWTAEHDARLADFCHRIHDRGGKFLLSNLRENERLIKALQDKFIVEELPHIKYKASVGRHEARKQTEVFVRN